MANKVVIWPVGKEASAVTYNTWTDAQWAAMAPGQGQFSYLYNDAYGQWVTPYLGPPLEFPVGTPIAEPDGGPAQRTDGVLADTFTPADQA